MFSFSLCEDQMLKKEKEEIKSASVPDWTIRYLFSKLSFFNGAIP